MYLEATTVIAVALVALVLVFVRISWTLKDIHEALVARGAAPAQAATPSQTQADMKAVPAEAAAEENEIAAVIAVAHAALAKGA